MIEKYIYGSVQEIEYLYGFLPSKELIFTQIISRTKEHVYHYVVQVSLWTSAPLHKDENRKVAK